MNFVGLLLPRAVRHGYWLADRLPAAASVYNCQPRMQTRVNARSRGEASSSCCRPRDQKIPDAATRSL